MESKNVKNTVINDSFPEDIITGDSDISKTNEEKYLGDKISRNAKYVRNNTDRKNKSERS